MSTMFVADKDTDEARGLSIRLGTATIRTPEDSSIDEIYVTGQILGISPTKGTVMEEFIELKAEHVVRFSTDPEFPRLRTQQLQPKVLFQGNVPADTVVNLKLLFVDADGTEFEEDSVTKVVLDALNAALKNSKEKTTPKPPDPSMFPLTGPVLKDLLDRGSTFAGTLLTGGTSLLDSDDVLDIAEDRFSVARTRSTRYDRLADDDEADYDWHFFVDITAPKKPQDQQNATGETGTPVGPVPPLPPLPPKDRPVTGDGDGTGTGGTGTGGTGTGGTGTDATGTGGTGGTGTDKDGEPPADTEPDDQSGTEPDGESADDPAAPTPEPAVPDRTDGIRPLRPVGELDRANVSREVLVASEAAPVDALPSIDDGLNGAPPSGANPATFERVADAPLVTDATGSDGFPNGRRPGDIDDVFVTDLVRRVAQAMDTDGMLSSVPDATRVMLEVDDGLDVLVRRTPPTGA